MHLAIPKIHDPFFQSGMKKSGCDVLQIREIHIIQHKSQVLCDRVRDHGLIILYQTEACRKLSASQVRLMIALAFSVISKCT